MLVMIEILALGFLIWIGPRLLVAGIALLIAFVLASQLPRAWCALLGAAADASVLDVDRKPSRAAQRAMKRSLRLALAQTELRSLFPAIMDGVDRWTGIRR